MLLPDIIMELPLDELPDNREILLSVGAENARDIHALCDDVAAMVFPSAVFPPTEATLSAATGKLVTIVSDIENRVQNDGFGITGNMPNTWSLLARSSFLRQPDLVDFVLARVAEDRLEAQIGVMPSPLAAKLLNHADANVAQAAQNLLAADSMHRRTRGQSYLALRPELLHQLCWRVVAATEVGNGERDPQVSVRARTLLSDYDERETAQSAAHMITHFAGQEYQAELSDLDMAGLHLYVANLATMLQVDHDHILRLIDSRSSAPLAIMLRAVGCEPDRAMATIFSFKGFSLTPSDINIFDQDYATLAHDVAQAEVRRWGYARTRYLAFQRAA